MRAIALASLLAVVGCGWEPPPAPMDIAALDVAYAPGKPPHPDILEAWQMLGGQGYPPRVEFVLGAALDCPTDKTSFLVPGHAGCFGGYYDPNTDVVKVSIPETWWRLPHELMHAIIFRREKTHCDPGHSGWQGRDILYNWHRAELEPVEKMLHERNWYPGEIYDSRPIPDAI